MSNIAEIAFASTKSPVNAEIKWPNATATNKIDEINEIDEIDENEKMRKMRMRKMRYNNKEETHEKPIAFFR